MLHELRVYTATPGKMLELVSRFDNHTRHLWERHGIELMGFWTTIVGPSSQQVTYLLRWTSLEERDAKFKAMESDPDWLAVVGETERHGPLFTNIENALLRPTLFSPMQ